jgi:hypothetical protein
MWLALLCASSTFAAPTVSERAAARGFMVEGDRLRDARDLLSALQQYQAAHALMHVPTTGLAVAEVLTQLGQLVEAHSAAQEVLNMPVAKPEPAAFMKAREAAVALASTLAERVCTVYTHVLPAGQYSLEVDGVALSEQALTVPVKLNPGPHSLRVRAPGYVEQVRQLNLSEGMVQHVEVALKAVPLPAAAEPSPRLNVANSAYPSDLDRERQSGRIRGFIGLGVGGFSLAVGLISGAVSWNQTSELKRHCDADHGCPAAFGSDLQTANTLGHVANIAVPLGLIGIAYGMYELLSLPEAARETSRTALNIDIDIAPNGVVVRGRL